MLKYKVRKRQSVSRKTKILLLVLWVKGVFLEKTLVTKREGETATLLLKQIHLAPKNFMWSYGRHSPILAISIVTNGELLRVNGTRFGDRLHTHVETGPVTISKLITSDSGIFMIQVFTESGLWNQTYNLTVCANRVIVVNGLVGTSVTLDTGVKELHKDQKVTWTKGRDFVGILVAEWEKNITTITPGFQDILCLDSNTGSLIFTNVKTSDSGYYCVVMLLWGDPHILRQYLVNVYEPVPKPHISWADTTTLPVDDVTCSVTCSSQNAPNDTLSWYKGEKQINQTCDPDMSRNLSLPLKIKNEEEDIYRCEANNPVDRKTVTWNSTEWCPPHSPGLNVPVIWIVVPVVGVLVLAAVSAVGVILWLMCRKRQRSEYCCRMSNLGQQASSQSLHVSTDGSEAVEGEGLMAAEGNQSDDQHPTEHFNKLI